MISAIRKKLVGTKFYKIIFWIVIIAMLGLWSLPGMLDKKSRGGLAPWGTVNGIDISRNDFDRKVMASEEHMRMIRAEYGQYADQLMQAMGMPTNPSLIAYEAVIREALLDQVADALNIKVHPEYVVYFLENIKNPYHDLNDLIPPYAIDPRTGGINREIMQQHLRRSRMSVSEFEEKLEQSLKRKLTSNLIAHATYVPLFELENEYGLRYLPKTFSVMTISKNEIYAEIKKDVISENDLETFFNRKNKANEAYWTPERRSVRVWSVTPHTYGISVTDEEVTHYYEQYKERDFVAQAPTVQVRNILLKASNAAEFSAAHEKAQQLRQSLLANPGEFAARAKELSADKETAGNGGLMKPFAKGDTAIDLTLAKGAFLLKNKGDISEPIQVKDGIVLLQLVEKTAKVYKPLSEVRKNILDNLTMQQFSKRFVSDMKEVYKDKNEAKLQGIITQKGGTAALKELITNDGSVLARTAFITPLNEYAFYVDGKEGRIVQVTDIQKRYLPTLDAVRETVKNDLIEERATSLLHARVMQAKKDAAKQSLNEIAHNYKAQVKKVGPVDVTNQAQLQALQKEGLPIESMLQIEKVGMTTVSADNAHGYVIRLDEVAPFNKEAFEGKRLALSEQTDRTRMMLITQGFVASLHRNATINLNSK